MHTPSKLTSSDKSDFVASLSLSPPQSTNLLSVPSSSANTTRGPNLSSDELLPLPLTLPAFSQLFLNLFSINFAPPPFILLNSILFNPFHRVSHSNSTDPRSKHSYIESALDCELVSFLNSTTSVSTSSRLENATDRTRLFSVGRGSSRTRSPTKWMVRRLGRGRRVVG